MKQPMSLRKRTVLQDVLLVLFAAVTLFSALLTVLSLIPEPAGLSVRERVTVSSARVNMEEERFQVESRGRLRNTSDRSVQVERVTVTVGGKNGITLEVTEPFTLPARADYDLVLSGTAAHAVGTSRAIQLGETEGAISGLAIGVAGLLTAFIVSALSAFL